MSGGDLRGVPGHLRTVADLLAAVDVAAVLRTAGADGRDDAADLDAAAVMAVAALRKVARIVEDRGTP